MIQEVVKINGNDEQNKSNYTNWSCGSPNYRYCCTSSNFSDLNKQNTSDSVLVILLLERIGMMK